jgi:ABC-2 type transport system ATP-binding protein
MIRLDEVTKEYGGRLRLSRAERVRALDGVSLEVPAGSALGIVGPNGAGKSTLLRLLLGYLRPTRGRVTVDGMAPRAYVERHGVSYVPDGPALHPRWTVWRAMEVFAALGEVPKAHDRIREELERMELDSLADRRVWTLSKGTLQRLAIAQALLGERKVMVLDEPATGLDPEWIARLREIVARWRAADPGRVLLVASHDLDEVERTADRVAVLGEGRVREVIDLRAAPAGLPAYRLEVEPAAGAADAVRAAFPGAVSEDGPPLAFLVRAADLAELNRRLDALRRGGVQVRALAPERQTLAARYRRGREGKR